MVGLGYVLKRIDFLSENDIEPLNKIVMYILIIKSLMDEVEFTSDGIIMSKFIE